MDALGKEGDVRLIAAHGLSVGLNDGLMGNSEVGCVRRVFEFCFQGSVIF
jgi:bisphosphoglycerate-independent phosphoglycerate mutase (AlkP superfamily)